MEKIIPQIEITVLVTAHNEADRIQPCLRAIMDQDYPIERIEILVVDDRSTDGTAERARSLGLPCLRVLRLEGAPEGLTMRQAALDLGLREARGEVVLVTDAGGRVPREWIRDLTGHLGLRDGAATAPVIFAGGQFFLARIQTIDTLILFALNRWANRHERTTGLMGTNMAIRRDAYLETGGFPVIGFALAEDMALGEALCRAGWSVRYLTAPVTLKPAEATLQGYLERARRRALNVPLAVYWVSLLMILSYVGLGLAAVVGGSPLWETLLWARYLIGVFLIGVSISKYGSTSLLFWVFFYEPVMVATGLYAMVSNLVARRWRWGGVLYDHARRRTPLPKD